MPTIEAQAEIDLDVMCDDCGALLDCRVQQPRRGTGGSTTLHIEPCNTCVSAAYNNGYDEAAQEQQENTDAD